MRVSLWPSTALGALLITAAAPKGAGLTDSLCCLLAAALLRALLALPPQPASLSEVSQLSPPPPWGPVALSRLLLLGWGAEGAEAEAGKVPLALACRGGAAALLEEEEEEELRRAFPAAALTLLELLLLPAPPPCLGALGAGAGMPSSTSAPPPPPPHSQPQQCSSALT